MEKNQKPKKTPASYFFLLVALLFQGLSGLVGGFGLISDPTGSSMSMSVEWLNDSPFDSYLIPGLILFLALGVFPIFVTYGIWNYRSWSWLSALLVGVMLIIFIVVEILMIGYQPVPPLQLFYGILGLVLIALVLYPSLRQNMNEKVE